MNYSLVQGNSEGYSVALLFDEKGRLLANGVPLTSPDEAERTLMRAISKWVKINRTSPHLMTVHVKRKVSNLANFIVSLSLGKIKPDLKFILREFSLDDHPWLTSKEVQVIKYLLRIPLGKVTSYKHISEIMGLNPRVVARIMAKNPYPIVYPCHRVIYADGRLGGYLGTGEFIILKKLLLIREGVKVKDNRVDKRYFISS